jgi:hypothetical protein
MFRATLLASSAVAALLLTACGPQDNPAQTQSQNEQQSQLATQPAPNVAERTAAEAANEVEQAAAPDAQITATELAAGISAVDVPSPESTLSTASVKTSAGQALGEVRAVTVGPDGRANAVTVEVGGFLNVGEHPVSIDAKKFTYLKDRNILVAAVTKSEVESMPVAKPQ